MRSCCSALQSTFDDATARRDSRRFRRRGPLPSTRHLVDSLQDAGAAGRLLDIGGGVGAVQLELLARGMDSVESVDASVAYTGAAQSLAAERDVRDRVHYHIGDFVQLAGDVEPADVVTLDRVLCCYPEWQQLVRLSAAKARSLYGVVVPRRTWPVRAVIALMNLGRAALRDPFRVFVHPTEVVDAAIRAEGFERVAVADTFVWRTLVFRRTAPSS